MQKPSINHTSSTNQSSSSSSITTHSLISSSSSSIDSSSSFQSQSHNPSRCFGLNLLVKAIHQVTAGSVIGVPYIQRRIVIRRRRPLNFENLILTTTQLLSESKPKSKSLKLKAKRKQRVNVTMPLKYRDSVIQPLTPIRRSERSKSIKITGE